MALTQADILRISEPVEEMYMNCTSQLIINISEHFKTGKGLATQAWQAQKLSEMGQLTDEAIEIIAANTGQKADVIRRSLTEAVTLHLGDEEKMLQAAAKKGLAGPNIGTLETSRQVQAVVKAYADQATDQLNLVNTVMLQSTQNRYMIAVQQVVAEEERFKIEALTSAKNATELAQQMGKVQKTLNVSTGSVVLGNESRTKALRDAIKTLADEGITGFIDAGGHHWTPEAYVNMDIRTTVGNTARQAQRARSEEYGIDTFQVSSHAAARPLCAPYQGWICSWSGGGYTVEDGRGREYLVHDINETSYGEPAGLFGINCGHNPITFVPGYSMPRYQELTPEQEKQNKIQYAESQQQRYLEREVRQSKTEALAYQAAGDKEGFEKAAQAVKQKTADYANFCDATGRTPRPDRMQVSGYNRSMAAKANAAARSSTPKVAQEEIKTISQLNERATNTLGVAYDRHIADNGLNLVPFKDANSLTKMVYADYGKLPVDLAETYERTLSSLIRDYDTPLTTVRTMTKEEVLAAPKAAAQTTHQYAIDSATIRINPLRNKSLSDLQQTITKLGDKGYAVKVAEDKAAEYVATHEFAHTLLLVDKEMPKKSFIGLDVKRIKRAQNDIKTIWQEYAATIKDLNDKWKATEYQAIMGNGDWQKAIDLKRNLDAAKISDYSLTNADEFMAEAFVSARLGVTKNQYAERVLSVLDNYFGIGK